MTAFYRRRVVRQALAGVLAVLASLGSQGLAASCPTGTVLDETVRRVLVLLPRQPACVVVVDVDRTDPATADRLRQYDAFTYRGGPMIFIRRHSQVYDLATQGERIYKFVLAAIIGHEMAHVAGGDECEAQHQEVALWLQFIRDARIGFPEGQAYLSLLRRRHCAAGDRDGRSP